MSSRLRESIVIVLFTGALGFLGKIASDLSDIKITLATAVTRIEEHERRIQNLETLVIP